MSAVTKNEALVKDLHKALLDKSEDVDKLYSDVRYQVKNTSRLPDAERARELGQRLATSNTEMRAADIEREASLILRAVSHYSNR